MPTGYRTTLNGVTINGVTYNGAVDLESVFHLRNGQTPAALTGYRSESGRDLSDWFVPLTAGGSKLGTDIGFRTSPGVDLEDIFAKAGTVGTAPGSGGGGGGCLPFETPVLLWTGGTKALGELRPGDVVIGYLHDSMIDESSPDWRLWKLPREDVTDGVLIPVTVVCSMVSEYPAHYLVNGELRATYEHRFFVLRGNEWQWIAAADLCPDDCFLSEDLTEVPVDSIEYIEQPMRVANVDVEEVDNFLFQAFGGVSILSHNPDEKN